MIRTFRHKGLRKFYETGDTRGIPTVMVKRIQLRLNVLDAAQQLRDLKLPGFNCHPLGGNRKGECSIHVNGPWALTFKFYKGDVFDLNLENYHN